MASNFDAVRAELAQTGVSATTMNFIVWIDDVTFRDWVLERTTKIIEKHPARAIVLDACRDREPGAKLVRREGDDADATHITVRGERVEIGVYGMTPDDIRDVTGSLTMNDVTTLLWWTGEGISGEPNFDALVEIADSIMSRSYILSGYVSDESTEELIRMQIAYLRNFLPETLLLAPAPMEE